MNQTLSIGQTVRSPKSGATCTVLKLLGKGGQGEVFKARFHDRDVALKWYYPHTATHAQRRVLEGLVDRGSPDESRFLWPQDVLVDPAVAGYGYVMPLREERFQGFHKILNGEVKPKPTFRTTTTIAFHIVDGYFQLHSRGLCYSDINDGNIFLDPASGDVLICDNDNVVVDGSPPKGVLGTPRYMAPEIVRSEAVPSRATDLHSLSVLLFYLFMGHHPLEGKSETAMRCFGIEAMNKLYGFEPRFVFDPNDKSNEPDPQEHPNALTWWPVYPLAVQSLFVKAFTEGLRDTQHGRVQENEWRRALVTLRDSIFKCNHCGAEIYYDLDFVRQHSDLKPCTDCKKKPSPPPRMRIVGRREVVVLGSGAKLYPHHVAHGRDYDFSSTVAEVSPHPSDPQKVGLKNLSPTKWTATTADGTSMDVDPGKTFHIREGSRVNFGGVIGEFKTT